MAEYLEAFHETWDPGDTVFIITLMVTFLIMLYTMTLIYNKIRLIEGELQAMRKDQSVISDELELVANLKVDQQPKQASSKS